MGLMDRVKEQASVASAKAKEQAATASARAKDAAQKGQAKYDAFQAKRTADAMLRDLGVAVYAQRVGRSTPDTPADIDRLVAALGEHEKANGPVELRFESPAGSNGAGPVNQS